MKSRYVLVLTTLSFSASAVGPESWLRPPPDKSYLEAKSRVEVSRKNIFEVPSSLFGHAEDLLTESTISPVDANLLSHFSGGHFSCVYPEKGFIVRAVYENGATGSFNARWLDSALWISHGALGPETGKHRTALLICLQEQPREVFVSSSSDL